VLQTPDLTVDYDMRKKTFSILHQEEVTSISSSLGTAGLELNISSIQQDLQVVEYSQSWSDLSKQFPCKQHEVISHDGVPIPLLILYSPEAHRHGESPGILYGYGAYGEDLDKCWCSERLSLLARGWVLAFADVRYVKVTELHFLINCRIFQFIILQCLKLYLFSKFLDPPIFGAIIRKLPLPIPINT
jgi:hypothetical protein